MSAQRYLLSFTGAGLRRQETQTLARAYREDPDWASVRRRAVEEDLLMIRQESSRKRVSGELVKRLRSLTPAELEALACAPDAPSADALAWVGVCRTYELIERFLENVVAERWHDGQRTLPEGAYEAFVDEESALHPELTSVSEGTAARLRSQLFTMLRDMGFLDKEGRLLPYLMPSGCSSVICEGDLAFFPTLVR